MLRLAVMEANVFRFACAKTDALARQLSTVARKSDTFQQFKKAADELNLVYNKRYLETEYNFAHAVGQNGAKYQRHLKEKEVFPYVIYQTIGDDRVRQAHRKLDGKIFRVGDEAYDLIAPPNGWGCRCELNQLTEDDYLDHYQGTGALVDKAKTIKLLKETPIPGGSNEYEYMVKHGFDKNRGKIGEVFDEKKDFYIRENKTVAPNIPTVEKAIARERRPGGDWSKIEAEITDAFPLNPKIFEHIPEGLNSTTIPGTGQDAGNNCYYRLHTKTVNLDLGKRWQRSPYWRSMVTTHELGHAIHYHKQIVTQFHVEEKFQQGFKAMQKTIKPRLPELYRKLNTYDYVQVKREIGELLEAKFPGKYTKEDVSEMLAAYADTIQALTNSQVGWGHKKSYMKGVYRYKEAFAHITENHFIGNPGFELIDPELYKQTLKIGKEIYGE